MKSTSIPTKNNSSAKKLKAPQLRKKIKESELGYKDLINKLPVAVYTCDAEGYVKLYNEAAVQIWGRKPESGKDKWCGSWKIYYSDGTPMPLDECPMAIALKKGRILKMEIIIERPDGTKWSVIPNPQPIYDADGNISGAINTLIDITPQVAARKKIEESEEQFSTLANSIQNLAWMAHGDGWIFWYNQRWYEYTGTTPEEMKGWGWKSVHDPEKLPFVLKQWQHSIETGQPFEMVFPLRGADGVFRSFLTRVFPIRNKEGIVIRWFGTNTDIHGQKTFSEKLEESVKERTRELEQANEELQKKNQEIVISKYNKRFLTDFSERFSGYKVHTEFFNSLVQYIADLTNIDYVFIGKLEQKGTNEFFIQSIALTAFGKLAENIQYPLPNGPCEQVIRGTLYSYPEKCRITFPKNQTLVQFNVEGYIGYPLFDADGNAVGLIAGMHEKIIEDPETVSAILKIVAKRAEIEMERIKHEETLVQNNKTLEEKNEQLESMNKELQSFAYITSHDLQEPLRKIQTFATRILEKENQNLSENGKDKFNRMFDAAKRMQTLIEDLLAYSRTNREERKLEYTDLNKILTQVKEELKEELQQKHATIEANEMCDANIIPFQFRQLMHNIIGNALKFSKPDIPPHIKIKSEVAKGLKFNNQKLLPQKNYCHIILTDNGIGFEPEYREKIFEVFQRLHGKEKYNGTGIGLAIVKKIVENHNGIITATSELGKGATFDIFIPAT